MFDVGAPKLVFQAFKQQNWCLVFYEINPFFNLMFKLKNWGSKEWESKMPEYFYIDTIFYLNDTFVKSVKENFNSVTDKWVN